MIPTTRICTKCSVDKPLEQFSKAPKGKHGRKASCKGCDASRHAAAFTPKVVDEEAKRARYTKNWDQPKCCSKCGETKERSEFAIARQGKYGPILKQICRACHAERERNWLQQSKDGLTSNRRRLLIEGTYGLTTQEYRDLLSSQGGLCAVCGETETAVRAGKKLGMSVDHCHETGRIRGILCNRCNRAMGLLGDASSHIQKAIDYLSDSGS